MKVIDVLVEFANGKLSRGFKFQVGDHRYTYYVGYYGYLCYKKEGDKYGNIVDWSIYQDWFNREIQIIKDDEDGRILRNYRIS